MNNKIVITTINKKTKSIIEFEKNSGFEIILIGDKKSNAIKNTNNLSYYSVNQQKMLGYQYVDNCPYNHYCRKNIGYLLAARDGADIIYDTDDDNIPYSHWDIPEFSCNLMLDSDDKYINSYQYFSNKKIWPRGFPLKYVNSSFNLKLDGVISAPVQIGVWQSLADGDPDVDAIYRLLEPEEIIFKKNRPVYLQKYSFSPFNSQNTFWRKELFKLLYLPSTVSFRFTDILRGYIAQKIMWSQGYYLGFMEALVFQERNAHDLMVDFNDEVPVYLNVTKVVEVIEATTISDDIENSMLKIYESLALKGLVDVKEVYLLKYWFADLNA